MVKQMELEWGVADWSKISPTYPWKVNAGVIEIWKTDSPRWKSIKEKKASWPIYNHQLEDKNSYSNGVHEKQIAGRDKMRKVMKKCKIKVDGTR